MRGRESEGGRRANRETHTHGEGESRGNDATGRSGRGREKYTTEARFDAGSEGGG